ncbi:MAG: histidine kinase [Saprospiraceae bacterium]|nr:histidine kinase [Saprospiraceae bacterium]
MHKLLIHITFLLFVTTIYGQIGIRHNQMLEKIWSDSLGNIVIQDQKNDLYQLKDQALIKINKPNQIVSSANNLSHDGIITLDNQFHKIEYGSLKELMKFENKELIKLTNKGALIYDNSKLKYITNEGNNHCEITVNDRIIDAIISPSPLAVSSDTLYFVCNNERQALPFVPNGLIQFQNNDILFSSLNQSLWILTSNNQVRRFYIPGINFPKGVIKMLMTNEYLWLLSTDKTLFNFNTNNQILKRVAVGVTDFAFDKWQKLWYITDNRIESNIDFINDELPLIQIQEIRCNNELISEAKLKTLNINDELQIVLKKNFTPKKDIRFEYLLEGQKSWVAFDNPLLLKNLQEGRNKVLIRGSGNDVYFTKPLAISYGVKTPISKSLWFYLFSGMALLSFILIFSQIRINRRNKISEIEKKALKLELQLLKTEQKFGQLQLNPHFIFNTMNSINGLIAIDKKSIARLAIGKFSRIMRQVLNFSFDDRISIAEELGFLETYLELEKLIRQDKFDYSIENNLEKGDIPPMMIQPFVENAILHGIQHKNGKGQLKIIFADAGRYIKVIVEDDGIGRQAAEKYRSESHVSNAVNIIKERIILSDKWKEKKPIEYVDLFENDQATGTQCILHIPK